VAVIALEIFYLCFRTSLLSFAGVYGALPELTRVFVTERGWITSHDLMESYMIGKAVPGPNMVLTVMIGYRVDGMVGACAAFVGTYAPPVLLMLAVVAVFRRYRSVSWVRRFELSLRPLVVGLMVGAAAMILREQATTQSLWATLIVLVVLAGLHVRRVLGPIGLMVAGGALFWAASAALAQL
jgi:chromate transporter